MVNNKNCRDLAARLRGSASAWKNIYPEADLHNSDHCKTIVTKVQPNTNQSVYAFLYYLADLIDVPTCKDFGGEEGTNGEHYDFACSRCGFCSDITEPNFCPWCGAEVIE